ncbi:MAG: hypothetical protein OXQ31_18115 [Spirochaetaceae bacterium]|nr:hypothetical protein [Spirochaetaceae bacterium]
MKTATLAPAARPPITSTIGVLSDRELLRQTSTLVRHERHLQGAIIDHLAEIEARQLFLRRGCSSLFDYAVRELGYSDAAAGRRIGAVRLCADQPGARERLRDGSLTLSAAAELQWAFDRQRRRGSISGIASTAPAAAGASGAAPTKTPALWGGAMGSAQAEVASAADPAADAATAAPPSHCEPAPPLVLDAAGRQKLVEEASGKSARQVRRMLADLDPELAPPADRVSPLGDGRYELKAVIDADCQQGLEHLRGLLSHVDPRMTVGQLVGRIVQEALDRHDPSRPPRRARTGSQAAQGESGPAPAAKDQAARERDHATAAQDAAVHIHATPTAEGTEGATRQPASPSLLSPGHDTASAAGTTPTAERAEERTPHPRPASVAPRTRQEATDRPAAARTTPAATTSTAKPCASGRAIPAAVKRQVWQRDGGRCSYLDRQTGRRCNSRHLIEIDHILPYALGGGADPMNLRL